MKRESWLKQVPPEALIATTILATLGVVSLFRNSQPIVVYQGYQPGSPPQPREEEASEEAAYSSLLAALLSAEIPFSVASQGEVVLVVFAGADHGGRAPRAVHRIVKGEIEPRRTSLITMSMLKGTTCLLWPHGQPRPDKACVEELLVRLGVVGDIDALVLGEQTRQQIAQGQVDPKRLIAVQAARLAGLRSVTEPRPAVKVAREEGA